MNIEAKATPNPVASREMQRARLGGTVDYPRDACLHELFEWHAAHAPNSVAVEQQARRLTYRELNRRANVIAAELVHSGLELEELVAVGIDRSIEFVVAILAILKAGGGYLPIDRSLPNERLEFLLKDSSIRFALVDESPPPRVFDSVTCLAVSDRETPLKENLDLPVNARNLAYVMYTSGSTGKPKGVAIEHRCVVRLVFGNEYVAFGPDRVFLQLAPVAFDAATFEIWGALLHGAKLVIAPPGIPDLGDLEQLIQRVGVTTLWLTAGLFNQIVEFRPTTLSGVQEILTGGEPLSIKHVRSARTSLPRRTRLINGYGPTECTTFACCFQIPEEIPDDWENIPIGLPIGNTEAWVLDAGLKPVPVGVEGELYLSGDGLARGYWNRPELTADTFIHHPALPHSRLYRTGDRVRLMENGLLEFRGRVGNQVKLRGFRIEPGEIEHALEQHPSIRQAVVVVPKLSTGKQELVAWCLPIGSQLPPESDIRDFLARFLPGYMIPTRLCRLARFPLTENGKVDRQRLSQLSTRRRFSTIPGEAPRNRTEAQVAEVVEGILGMSEIGIHDNFLELGIDSLQAMRLVIELENRTGRQCPLNAVFQFPSIAGVAENLSAERKAAIVVPRLPESDDGFYPVTHSQLRLLLDESTGRRPGTYNLQQGWRIRGSLDLAALQKALNWVLCRHDSLRTTYHWQNGIPVQRVESTTRVKLKCHDRRDALEVDPGTSLASELKAIAEKGFDLSQDLMLRPHLFRLADRDWLLLLNFHHLASDARSEEILEQELGSAYAAFSAGTDPAGTELPIRPIDFAAWQRAQLDDEFVAAQLQYWERQLGGLVPLPLPRKEPRSASGRDKGHEIEFELNPELTEDLRRLASKLGVTVQMLLLAAFQTLLSAWSRHPDIAVAVPTAGRIHAALQSLVGFFVNPLIIRTDFSGDPRFTDVLEQVRRNLLDALDFQELPFDVLVDRLRPNRDPAQAPFSSVAFQILPRTAAPGPWGNVEVSRFKPKMQFARYDLELYGFAGSGQVHFKLVFSTEAFDLAVMKSLANRYQALISRVIARPDQLISELIAEDTDIPWVANPSGNAVPPGGVEPPPSRPMSALGMSSAKAAKTAHCKDLGQSLESIRQFLILTWCRILDLSSVGIHENFFEIGGHSLLGMGLVAEVQKTLGLPLNLGNLYEHPTISKLARWLHDHRESDHAFRAFEVRNQGELPPLFVMPGLSGEANFWRSIAAQISPDRPTRALGLAGGTVPWSPRATLEEIGSHCVMAIERESGISRGMHLAGYSFGGMLAFETARQLVDRGHEVLSVAIFDTGPGGGGVLHRATNFASFVLNLPVWMVDFLGRPREWPSEFRRKWNGIRNGWRNRLGNPLDPPLNAAINTSNMKSFAIQRAETCFRAFTRYQPGPYSGHIVLFRARVKTLFQGHARSWGWDQFTLPEKLKIEWLPGNHKTLMSGKNYTRIANRLEQIYQDLE